MANWLGSGYSFDTCCRMGWADEMRGSTSDIEKLKRQKIDAQFSGGGGGGDNTEGEEDDPEITTES